MHFLGTCEKRTAEYKRLPKKNAFLPQKKSDFAIAQRNDESKKKKRTDKDLSLLCILILGTHSKFAWENNLLALGVCCVCVCVALFC